MGFWKKLLGYNSRLIDASREGRKDVVELLLAKGADVNAKTNTGTTALWMASAIGHKEVVQALLANGADVNAKNNDGETALMGASRDGHKEVVQVLLANGADANAMTNYYYDGETALMMASRKGHKEVVQALLAKGADVNAKSNDGETALMGASRDGHKEVVGLLLDKGATGVYFDTTGTLKFLRSEWFKAGWKNCSPAGSSDFHPFQIPRYSLRKLVDHACSDPQSPACAEVQIKNLKDIEDTFFERLTQDYHMFPADATELFTRYVGVVCPKCLGGYNGEQLLEFTLPTTFTNFATVILNTGEWRLRLNKGLCPNCASTSFYALWRGTSR